MGYIHCEDVPTGNKLWYICNTKNENTEAMSKCHPKWASYSQAKKVLRRQQNEYPSLPLEIRYIIKS